MNFKGGAGNFEATYRKRNASNKEKGRSAACVGKIQHRKNCVVK